MKTWIKLELSVLLLVILLSAVESCREATNDHTSAIALNEEKASEPPKKKLSEAFKKYWYSGEAEITSYKLEQARYGEMREGEAVLIYVTEPFRKGKQVKADDHNADNIAILKLNATKNYLTGIYPYSIMTSSFYPVHDNGHALKVSFSSQEWCGQVYAQINNRDQYEIMSHSYFESEGDQDLKVEKSILENELWNKIRIDPNNLPEGSFEVIPTLEYIRLSHKELKPYNAILTLTKTLNSSFYEINYPDLQRSVKIEFTSSFPHEILGWTETSISGYGKKAKQLTSKAIKMKTIKTPYWQKNSNEYLSLRDSLGL